MESLISRLKAELRKKIRQMEPPVAEDESAIERGVLDSPEYKAAELLLTYYGEPGREPLTDGIINRALSDGKRVALPVSEDGGRMVFYEISSLSELSPGRFGIPAPPVTNRMVVGDVETERNTPALALVPAMAFDMRGHRLGRGGGYYDRFLKAYPIPTLGLCFESRLVDNIPCETYDVPVGAIITEKRRVDAQRAEL